LPDELADLIRDAVRKGSYASEEELVVAALRNYLGRQESRQIGTAAAGLPASAERKQELSDQELQRRLVEAGVLSEIKPPITDLTPYLHRQAVPIRGEPLSETILRERR
jgi:Arc/MetJ-type ribon-helix-helix transcriptional regulator